MEHAAGPENRLATVSTYFEIAGDDLDPAACTQGLDLEPTDSWLKGQMKGRGRVPVRQSAWTIKSPDLPATNLDGGLQPLLDTLWPVRDSLHRLVAESPAPLSVAFGSIVKIHHDVPDYHLPPGTIARLAGMEAEYWPDIYDFRSPTHRGGGPGSGGGMDPGDSMPYVTTFCEISGSELDPDALSGGIGVQPTATRIEPGHGSWRLGLEDQRGYNTEDGLKALLDRLWPVRENLARFLAARPAIVTFGSSVRMYHDNLVYGLTPPTLHRLAAFGAHYSLDIQDFRE